MSDVKLTDPLHVRLLNLVKNMEGEYPPHVLEDVRTAAKQIEAFRALHHAVCGDTGFANAVRIESGLAYPWPALDDAEALAAAAISDE